MPIKSMDYLLAFIDLLLKWLAWWSSRLGEHNNLYLQSTILCISMCQNQRMLFEFSNLLKLAIYITYNKNQVVFSLNFYTKYIQNAFGMKWSNNKICTNHISYRLQHFWSSRLLVSKNIINLEVQHKFI
jgi:hypothetical protein